MISEYKLATVCYCFNSFIKTPKPIIILTLQNVRLHPFNAHQIENIFS